VVQILNIFTGGADPEMVVRIMHNFTGGADLEQFY
jgi:hypothetical protein